MLKRKVLKIQDSLYVAIPKQLCDLLGIEKGDTVSINFVENRLIVEFKGVT